MYTSAAYIFNNVPHTLNITGHQNPSFIGDNHNMRSAFVPKRHHWRGFDAPWCKHDEPARQWRP